MFWVILCCNQQDRLNNTEDEYLVTNKDKKIELTDYLNIEDSEEVDFESNRWKVYQRFINNLKEAEREAHEIVAKAKKNRLSYLNNAQEAANEIVLPYYKLANEELKQIETSIDQELHINSLENILSQKDEVNQSELEIKMKEATSYLLSKVCDIKLELKNPEYVAAQINKHKIKNKGNKKKNELRNKLKSWRSKNESLKIEKKETNNRKIKFDTDTEKTTSSVDLDEDYSKIDNMYGASRIISSFNTIHMN